MDESSSLLLEACTEGFSQSFSAQQRGAHRIELCENLAVGGTTPSYGMIKVCKEKLHIPISVMIRPRGGSFVYTVEEIEIMKNDIQSCKEIGVDGVVFGVLKYNSQGQCEIDTVITSELAALSHPLEVTNHMAFDETDDLKQALEDLIKLNIKRVLTRGGKQYANASQGRESLKQLIIQANQRITIMPGKGISSTNYKEIAQFTKAQEMHGTQIV